MAERMSHQGKDNGFKQVIDVEAPLSSNNKPSDEQDPEIGIIDTVKNRDPTNEVSYTSNVTQSDDAIARNEELRNLFPIEQQQNRSSKYERSTLQFHRRFTMSRSPSHRRDKMSTVPVYRRDNRKLPIAKKEKSPILKAGRKKRTETHRENSNADKELVKYAEKSRLPISKIETSSRETTVPHFRVPSDESQRQSSNVKGESSKTDDSLVFTTTPSVLGKYCKLERLLQQKATQAANVCDLDPSGRKTRPGRSMEALTRKPSFSTLPPARVLQETSSVAFVRGLRQRSTPPSDSGIPISKPPCETQREHSNRKEESCSGDSLLITCRTTAPYAQGKHSILDRLFHHKTAQTKSVQDLESCSRKTQLGPNREACTRKSSFSQSSSDMGLREPLRPPSDRGLREPSISPSSRGIRELSKPPSDRGPRELSISSSDRGLPEPSVSPSDRHLPEPPVSSSDRDLREPSISPSDRGLPEPCRPPSDTHLRKPPISASDRDLRESPTPPSEGPRLTEYRWDIPSPSKVDLHSSGSKIMSDTEDKPKASAISKWHRMRLAAAAAKREQEEAEQKVFLQRFSTNRPQQVQPVPTQGDPDLGGEIRPETRIKTGRYVISPEGDCMYMWLAVLSLCVLYNVWIIIAREAFVDLQKGHEIFWLITDGIADLVYVIDIGVQMRTGYLEMGMLVRETQKLVLNYVKSVMFIYDLLALLPLDLLQFRIGIHPILRFPRFIKIYRTLRFMNIVGMKAFYPNVWRVANLTHMLFLAAHYFAAFYFLLSRAERFKGNWNYPEPIGVYGSVSRQYLRSLYWATMTLSNIGDIRHPETSWEYGLSITSYLLGVFIFAAIVGQVGNVIATKNAARADFERLLDSAKTYMHERDVPHYLQSRVVRWYNYAWSRGRIGGAGGDFECLSLLPDKLKTELALFVNMGTLKKVTIFQQCEPEFLQDVVLKMKAFIFTPGDMVVRKGEVAREMFIISDGMVEVTNESGKVVATMVTGDFFGEIGILNLDSGLNRRSADVRSVGYSELLVLLRSDVLNALKDYPTAEQVLKSCAMNRLKSLKQVTPPPPTPSKHPLLAALKAAGATGRGGGSLIPDPSAIPDKPKAPIVTLGDLTQMLVAEKRARERINEQKKLEAQSKSIATSMKKTSPFMRPKGPPPSISLMLPGQSGNTPDQSVKSPDQSGKSPDQSAEESGTTSNKEPPVKKDVNTSNNNIYMTSRYGDVSGEDDGLMYWQSPFVRFKNMGAGENVAPWEFGWETQVCRETGIEDDIALVEDNSFTCDNSAGDNAGVISDATSLQPLLSRADDDEEEGAKDGDVKNLLDGVQQLFDGKVKRIHKYYQTKIEQLQADVLKKQQRIEELEYRETL